MKIRNEIVLVSGANRGLGRALVEATLAAGAEKVYAGARDPTQLAELVAQAPERIVPLALDITDRRSLANAAERAPDVAVLFNNAGVLASYSVLGSRDDEIAQDFATNTFGLLAATKAFLPALERAAKRGTDRAALVNVLSIASLTNLPALGGYSASKAAAYSLTQALRWELGARAIAVHGVLAGAIDTDMVRAMDMPKTSPDEVARNIVRDVERGLDDILPESASQGMFEVWRRDHRELERQLAQASGVPTRAG
jgi:NAD(P)-dependent dehydrogenase (short-subunit alcohol dehydrogenase family)